MSGSRDGAGAVVRISAGADDGGIADAAVALARHASGGGGSRKPSLAVHGDRTHRAHMRNRQRRQCGVAAADALELLPALGGVKVALRHQCHAAAQGEFLGARAMQHDELRMLHDGARQFDWVSDAGHAAHGSRLQSAAVHDCRIQFIVPVEREHGPAAGVEQRIILERHDGARDGIDAIPSSRHRAPRPGRPDISVLARRSFPCAARYRRRHGWLVQTSAVSPGRSDAARLSSNADESISQDRGCQEPAHRESR